MADPNIVRSVSPRPPSLLGLAAGALTLLAIHPANAQNFVSDPGFEQAARGGYTAGQSLGDGWTATQGNVGVYNNGDYVFDGGHSLAVADGFANDTAPSSGTVSQVLGTMVGQTYTLSFFADGNKSNALTVLFDGRSVFSGQVPVKGFNLGAGGQNPSAPNFTFYSFAVTATSAQASLSFQGQSAAGGTVVVDAVSVSPAPEASVITSLSLGVTCLIGLLLTARRQAGRRGPEAS
jgi:hypothetical protein